MSLVRWSGYTLTQGEHGPELRRFPGLWLVIHRVAALVRQWALWVLNPAPWHSVQHGDASYTEQRSWDICWKHCQAIVANLQKLRHLLLHIKNSLTPHPCQDLKLAAVNFDPYHEHTANSVSCIWIKTFQHWILILTNLKAHLDKYPQMTEKITVHFNVTFIIKSWYLIWWLGRNVRSWQQEDDVWR